MSLLQYGSRFIYFTRFYKIHVINQLTKTPRKIMLELRIIITEHMQSFTEVNVLNTQLKTVTM